MSSPVRDDLTQGDALSAQRLKSGQVPCSLSNRMQ